MINAERGRRKEGRRDSVYCVRTLTGVRGEEEEKVGKEGIHKFVSRRRVPLQLLLTSQSVSQEKKEERGGGEEEVRNSSK